MRDTESVAVCHRKMPLDETRRHFVFGDIHGRYATFLKLLDLIDYDESSDVIYSVGDLIDRGPDSASVVEFFKGPDRHAILGNHEQMTINRAYWEQTWLQPYTGGPATLKSLERAGHDIEWLFAFTSTLPVCLDVGDESQSYAFRLIHAECPLEWSESRLMDYLRDFPREEVVEGRLLWGREDIEAVAAWLSFGNRYKPEIAKARSSRTVFCGHTPVEDVISAFNVHWIDTFAGGKMTCMNALEKVAYQLPVELSDRPLF